MVEAGNIVYKVTADFSDLQRAETAATGTFKAIGQEGQQAFAEITAAIERAATLITGALHAAFQFTPDQLTAGIGHAREALAAMAPPAKAAEEAIGELANDLDAAGGEAQQAARAIDQTGDKAEEAGHKTRGMGKAMEDAAERAGKLGLAFLGIREAFEAIEGTFGRVKEFMVEAVASASDLNESINKSNEVFKQANDVVIAWAQNAANTVGLSRQQAIEAAASFGNLLVTMGQSREKAAEMSTQFVQLAADLASFHNTRVEDALDALRAGLIGESEPLRRFGVLLNEDAVAAKAVALGLATSTNAVTDQAKVIARYALIMEQTKTAQGDFARTADGLANSQRRLSAALGDLRETIGAQILPLIGPFVNKLVDVVNAANALPGPIKEVAAAIGLAVGAFLALAPAVAAIGFVFGAIGGPIAIAIAALAALGAGVVLLIRHWGDLTARFPQLQEAVDAVGQAFQWLADRAGEVAHAIGVTLSQGLAIVTDDLKAFWEQLVGVVRIIGAVLTGQFDQVGAIVKETDRRVAELGEHQQQAARRIVAAWQAIGAGVSEHAHRVERDVDDTSSAVEKHTEKVLTALDAYNAFAAAIGESDKAISVWKNNLQKAQDALATLEEKKKAGIALTKDEKAQYDLLTWYVARLKGGIGDLEAQQRMLVVAQAEYTRELDNLNQLLKDGKISQEEYTRRVGELSQRFSDAIGPAQKLQQAGAAVADALQKVADRLEELLRKLGVLPPDVRIVIRAEMEQARRNIVMVNQEIDGIPPNKSIVVNADTRQANQAIVQTQGLAAALPSERLITVKADIQEASNDLLLLRQRAQNMTAQITVTVDASQVYPELDRLANHLPHSPAKEGPLSDPPNWQWLFEGLLDAAKGATSDTLERLDKFAGGLRTVMDVVKSALDIGKTWAEMGGGAVLRGVPWEDLLTWLEAFARDATRRLTAIAADFKDEVLDRASKVTQLVGTFFDTVGRAVSVAKDFQDLEADVADMAWGRVRDWLTGFAKSSVEALAAATEALGVAAIGEAQALTDAVRGVFEVVGSAVDAAKRFTELTDDPATLAWEKFAAWLGDFARAGVKTLGDAAADIGKDTARHAQELAGALKDLFDVVGKAIDTAKAFQQLKTAPWELAWANLREWLVRFGTETVKVFGDAAQQIDRETLRHVQRLRDGLDAVFGVLTAALGAVKDVSGKTLAAVALVAANREPLARAIASLGVTFGKAIGEAARDAGAALPRKETVDTFFAPLTAVLTAIDTVARLANDANEKALALPRGAVSLGRALVTWAQQLQQAVAGAIAAVKETLPETGTVEAFFAPVKAVLDLMDGVQRLMGQGQGSAAAPPVDVGATLRALQQLVRGTFAVVADLTRLPLPSAETLAPLSLVADAVTQVITAVSGAFEKVRFVSPEQAEAMADTLGHAIAAFVTRLTETTRDLAPAVKESLTALSELVSPLGAIIDPVSSALSAALATPWTWEMGIDAFLGAMRKLIQGLAALRGDLAGGLEDARAVAASVGQIADALAGVPDVMKQVTTPGYWETVVDQFLTAVRRLVEGLAALRGDIGGAFADATAVARQLGLLIGQLTGAAAGVTVTAAAVPAAAPPQPVTAGQLNATVNVRVWVGDVELRQIVRQEVDAVLETVMRTVR